MAAAEPSGLGNFYDACNKVGLPWPQEVDAEEGQRAREVSYGPLQQIPVGLMQPAQYRFMPTAAGVHSAGEREQFAEDLKLGWRDNHVLHAMLREYLGRKLVTGLLTRAIGALPELARQTRRANSAVFAAQLCMDGPNGRQQTTLVMRDDGVRIPEVRAMLGPVRRLASVVVAYGGEVQLASAGTCLTASPAPTGSGMQTVGRDIEPFEGNMLVMELPHKRKASGMLRVPHPPKDTPSVWAQELPYTPGSRPPFLGYDSRR